MAAPPRSSQMPTPKAVFLMADYGHDLTETALPWQALSSASFAITFATEHGAVPACDRRMLTGATGLLLGATARAKDAYVALTQDAAFQHPAAWTAPTFDLADYDVVVLPGGHDRGVRQLLDSAHVHRLLAAYFPLTRRQGGEGKSVVAICHGVQVLAAATYALGPSAGKSVLHDATTTALLHGMEEFIYQLTRVFLGDYYKTYGKGTPSVQQVVEGVLDDKKQFQTSFSPGGFVVRDERYNYLSGRFPPDAEELGRRAVEMVREAMGTESK